MTEQLTPTRAPEKRLSELGDDEAPKIPPQ